MKQARAGNGVMYVLRSVVGVVSVGFGSSRYARFRVPAVLPEKSDVLVQVVSLGEWHELVDNT